MSSNNRPQIANLASNAPPDAAEEHEIALIVSLRRDLKRLRRGALIELRTLVDRELRRAPSSFGDSF